MELSKLSSAATTELTLLHPVTNQPTDIIVSGYTPDSKEWKKIEKDITGPAKKQALILQKGQQKIELDGDGVEKRNQLLLRTIVSIKGITQNSNPVILEDDIAITAFLKEPSVEWMLEQWGEHVDDRSNFFASASPSAISGSNVSDS